MEKMWYRDKAQDVEVYHIDPEKKVALCFSAFVCQLWNLKKIMASYMNLQKKNLIIILK